MDDDVRRVTLGEVVPLLIRKRVEVQVVERRKAARHAILK